jgi:hypothetical protein
MKEVGGINEGDENNSGFSNNGEQWACNKQTIKLQFIEAMTHSRPNITTTCH